MKTKKSSVEEALFRATGAWVATVLSYTLFNYAIVLASGTLTASAVMNFIGGLLRLPELIRNHSYSKQTILIGVLGGICLLLIAAPLWLAYQISGGSGIILTIVYDSMLVSVCLIGPFVGLIPKPDRKGMFIIFCIACLAAFRVLYHHSEIHWTNWLVLFVFLITVGYMGFNMAVKKSKQSVVAQIVMNWIGALLLLLFSLGLWSSTKLLGVKCSVSCNIWEFSPATNIAILLGGVAIYCIVRFLAMLYVQLNMQKVSGIRFNLSGFTMPLVYEGLVVFGAITLSYVLHKNISLVDIIISVFMLLLVIEDMKHHVVKHKI